jgi:DNA-binding MarR family transcriptional regulator
MAGCEHKTLVAQVEAFVDKILNLEKRQFYEVDGQKLYPSEIHLLLLIDAQSRLNATGLAERLGLSKGAISQTLTRLEKKGVLIKSRDPASKNELILEFTTAGQKVLRHFRGVQAAVRKRYDEIFTAFDEDEREVIGRFFQRLHSVYGRCR